LVFSSIKPWYKGKTWCCIVLNIRIGFI
jgi:hypothetical protein